MKHLGDYDTGGVIYGKFTTYRPSTGAPFTLGSAGSGPQISVYKDGSATQSIAGVTFTTDFDGLAGLNHVAIDTSADGTFYAAGSHYEVVVTDGQVDGVSLAGACVFSFSLRKDSSLKTGTNAGAVSFTGGVTISNASGDALTLSSTGGNGNGLNASGNGSGDGIHAVAGATGRGIHAQGGATSGAGINATGSGGNANGITANGNGSGHGIAATGGATGDGVHGLGGATSGAGVVAEARGGNSNGLSCIAFGTGVDLAADNLATNAQAAAIKAKTDSLTFTVAGQVDANVQYVNDAAVTGNGQPGTEWGPA